MSLPVTYLLPYFGLCCGIVRESLRFVSEIMLFWEGIRKEGARNLQGNEENERRIIELIS
ncbi:hypothetical protein EG338_10325 [Kaistella haifensis]|nr:hypothetical protein EG338_10325 [Kaistella haifensis]